MLLLTRIIANQKIESVYTTVIGNPTTTHSKLASRERYEQSWIVQSSLDGLRSDTHLLPDYRANRLTSLSLRLRRGYVTHSRAGT
jgi:hypothetical protein